MMRKNSRLVNFCCIDIISELRYRNVFFVFNLKINLYFINFVITSFRLGEFKYWGPFSAGTEALMIPSLKENYAWSTSGGGPVNKA